MLAISLRNLVPKDAEAAAAIFFDAVHHGTANVYSAEQRLAWAGFAPDLVGWTQKFKNISGLAAELDGELVGFMTLDPDGYIDLAFVRSDLAGRGIGRSLYRKIEARAVSDGIARLTTEASKKAKPFFLRLGWQIDQQQDVVKAGVSLTNFKMSKSLLVAA